FSSRRRHTRFSRDWSSDVCSSDLQLFDHSASVSGGQSGGPLYWYFDWSSRSIALFGVHSAISCFVLVRIVGRPVVDALPQFQERSEERRVGKEWRSVRRQSARAK